MDGGALANESVGLPIGIENLGCLGRPDVGPLGQCSTIPMISMREGAGQVSLHGIDLFILSSISAGEPYRREQFCPAYFVDCGIGTSMEWLEAGSKSLKCWT